MSWSAHRLWAAMRWPTAAATCGLSARLDWLELLARPSNGSVALPLVLLDGTTHDDVERALPSLASLYGCARLELERDRVRTHRCSVTLHRLALPPAASLPMTSQARLFPPSAVEAVPLGLDGLGRVVGLPLFSEKSGGTTVLIGGVPGSGKSMTLRVILAAVAPTTSTLLVIDPTGGAEASLWGSRMSACVSSAEPAPTCELLQDVLDLIKRRGELLGAGEHIAALHPVVLVCDELAELAAAGSPKQQEEARQMLRRIVALGRKANIACVLATQRTTAASIDVTTRSLAGWRIALAHPDDPHGSEALLGPGRRDAALLRKPDVGVALLTNGGPPMMLRVFELDAARIPAVPQAPSRSLAELSVLEEVRLRGLAM